MGEIANDGRLRREFGKTETKKKGKFVNNSR
jgi:hypothetical protein